MVNQGPVVHCWILWLHTDKLLTMLVLSVVRMAFPWMECLSPCIHRMLCLLCLAVAGVHSHPTHLGMRPQALGFLLRAFIVTFTSES